MKKRIKFVTLSLLLSFLSLAGFAQKVTGTVLDENSVALPFANVLLLNSSDSTLVKASASDMDGKFEIKDLKFGSYLFKLSMVGYTDFYTPKFQLSTDTPDFNLQPLMLARLTSELAEVTVKVKKPFIEQQIDRTVLNVKNSITNAGSTVLDVLRKSPGVTVNQNSGTITMAGKDGVQVMINGKLSYIPASALISTLQGMNSNNVERIELITTPPAKFDAAGNAGYINIVLSQRPDEGFNGSVSLTAAAFEGTAPSADLDLNYRKNKINLYGSYSFSRRAQLENIQSDRSVLFKSVRTDTHINSDRDPFQLNNGFRLGLDVDLGKKTTLGVLLSGYRNEWQMKAFNTSATFKNGVEDSHIEIKNTEKNLWKHNMGNFNIQHQFAGGGDLNFNIDFLTYDNYNPTRYISIHSSHDVFQREDELGSSKKTLLSMLPVSLDFTKKLTENLSLETGLKVVQSQFSNDVLVEEKIKGIWTPVDEFTADYRMKENVAAAYLSANYNHGKKNTFKGGLRYEYTTNNLGSNKQRNIVDRNYGYLFPTIYWNHKINNDQSFNLSYNKRINRPNFNDLAPFVLFMDPNTFISGNSALQPAIADNVSLGYNIKMVSFALNYAYQRYTIGDFQLEIDAENNKVFYLAQNLKYSESVFLTASFPTKIAKWWNGQINVSGARNHSVADVVQNGVSVSTFTYNLSGFQSFKISNRVDMELSGFYQSRSLDGIAVMKPVGQLNYGVSWSFPKSNASLKFGIDNMFSTMKFTKVNNDDELSYRSTATLDMIKRIMKITYSQSFGNSKVKASRNRTTASETERQRVNH